MDMQAVFVLLFAWFCISVANPVKQLTGGSHNSKGTNTASVGRANIGRAGSLANKILIPGKKSSGIKLLETSHLLGTAGPFDRNVLPSQNDLGLDNSFSTSTNNGIQRDTRNNKRSHDFDDWDSWESSDEHSHRRGNEIRRDHSDWDSWEWDSGEFHAKERFEKNHNMRGGWTVRDDWEDWDSDISSEGMYDRGNLNTRPIGSHRGLKRTVDDWDDEWDLDSSSEDIEYRSGLKFRQPLLNNRKKGTVDDWDDWDSDISSMETDDWRKVRHILPNNRRKGTIHDQDDWDSDTSSWETDDRRLFQSRTIMPNNRRKGILHDRDDWDSDFSDEKRDSAHNQMNSRTNNGLKRNFNYQSDSSDWFDDWSDERFEQSNGNVRKPHMRMFSSRKDDKDDFFGDWSSEQSERTHRRVGRNNKRTLHGNNRSNRLKKDNLYFESDENEMWDNARDNDNERQNTQDPFLKRVQNAFLLDLDDMEDFNKIPMKRKTMLPKGIQFIGKDN
ncbi:bifunctional endo-1,4-beta-xylanase XylA-like [Mytilus trossulus]|uniref:bifunctional endo-1,4-beta-xylanase XylA-like n=1 Tax=Mytilus trossulus TaxID=6551 RepID=UPI0030066E12